MKKTIIILFIFLISVAGCSYTGSSKKQISDPMSFAKARLGSTFYSKNDNTTYKSIQKFTNNNTTPDGITSTDNKNFKTKFSYLVVENTKTHERYLGYFGDIINETPNPIKFTGDVKIIIGKNTVLDMPKPTSLVDELDVGTKKRGYALTKLDSKKQLKHIEIEINKPLDTYHQQDYSEKVEITLYDKHKK
ncbi:hypothetical protein [Staphylococcus caeli]|uniref:hypothetical protein n=1 Tax=Staphylococcus caeli TaxID=2201815 RepID=UPI003F568DB3